MSFNLPGMYLYYLSRDNLAPEEYERIISPHAAWARICREYEFDDSHNTSRYLINMREREQRSSPDQPRPGGIREKEKLEKLVFSGDVVMLSDMYGPARLFYINGEGQLMSADPHAFRFEGAAKIIKAFDDSVKCRNYQRTGGKPRPTKSPMKVRPSVSELPVPKAFGPINSKAAGRLLAAGGVYNQNPEMFADTAKKLGGDAAKGFDQVLNEQSAGSLVALSSMLMLGRASVAGRPSVASLGELKNYLGKTKGEQKLLNNIDVIKMDYIRRDRAELITMRGQFRGVRSKFLKSISDNPEVKKRFDSATLADLANGKAPKGWDVHHKLPLDDSGTNDVGNLVLIKRDFEHNLFTNTQSNITRQIGTNGAKEILWPVPKGVIYP
ncbi:HNH endonuclease signature motif containing protein [Yersinia similis]|uniref:HNH endonuclease signature motif containing protein n=1 Tax=Yersinia similis TaxID=367190 RepID=UPI001643D202|nr:HNH endonuclease signature motif containing protein [Yersinia similis]